MAIRDVARRDVLCAGCLHTGYNCQTGLETAGILSHIDNSSGHYRPDANALRRCVQILAGEGIDVSHVRVADWSRGGDHITYHWGDDFLLGAQPWQDINTTTCGSSGAAHR